MLSVDHSWLKSRGYPTWDLLSSLEATAIQNSTCRSEEKHWENAKEKASVAEVKGESDGEKWGSTSAQRRPHGGRLCPSRATRVLEGDKGREGKGQKEKGRSGRGKKKAQNRHQVDTAKPRMY